MSEIHYYDITSDMEAWCLYETNGLDAKCLICFDTESEARSKLGEIKSNNQQVRLIHFPISN